MDSGCKRGWDSAGIEVKKREQKTSTALMSLVLIGLMVFVAFFFGTNGVNQEKARMRSSSVVTGTQCDIYGER